MGTNRLAFAALGIACVAAAAGGGYMATRHNAADQSAIVGAVATPAETAIAAQPVSETEPVRESMPAGEPTPVPAPRPTTTRATEAPRAVPPAKPTTGTRSVPATQIHVEQPALERSAPTLGTPAPLPSEPVQVARTEDRAVETNRAPEAPSATFEELTVSPDSVIGLQTETTLSSERARIEDRVEARVVRDVRVSGRVAIPAGTRALGSVVVVERGGKLRERARLGIRFHTLALPDGTRLPITTETIYRYGDAPGNSSAAKIGGGAVAGAILGAILGGGKGAAIGATTGAAGGGAAVMTGDRSEAIFPSGAEVTARILAPVTVTLER